jgi:hypothetical protein
VDICGRHFNACAIRTLSRGVEAQVAAPVQPRRAALEAPLQEAASLVELADEDEQLVCRRVDACGQVDYGAIEPRSRRDAQRWKSCSRRFSPENIDLLLTVIIYSLDDF